LSPGEGNLQSDFSSERGLLFQALTGYISASRSKAVYRFAGTSVLYLASCSFVSTRIHKFKKVNTMTKRFAAFFFALFVLALAGCGSTPQQASTGQYIDDSVITTKVKAAIFEEPNLKTLQIGVETFKGIVQLSGFVNNSAASLKASDVARKVEGVKGVKNSLVVK